MIRRYTLPALVIVGILGLIFFFIPRAASEPKQEPFIWPAGANLPKLPETFEVVPEVAHNPTNPNIQAYAAVLIDSESSAVLYAERPQAPVPIASTTKLMTAILARSLLDLDQVVDITREQVSVIGSDMALRPGEKITVRSLLNGLLIVSGNDAAWVLAETAGGSKEHFVELMNQKAKDLGLSRTTYFDPAGLDDRGHSTAFELSIIARAALLDPVISQIVKTTDTTVTSVDGRVRHDLVNSNHLVSDFQYTGAIGLKTGFTPDAGHCLVAAAERNGHRLIAVILHTDADTITASAIEARKLLDWGWQNTTWQ